MQLSNPNIHGHEVLEMMMASDKQYSKASLIDEIDSRFGKSAVFHTCSAEDLSASALIELLWAHGKFSGVEEAFVFDPSKKCDH